VVVCSESLRQCTRTVPDDGLVFGPGRRSEPASPRERQLVAEVARLTRSGRADLGERGTLALLADERVRVRAEEGKKLLIGGQYLRAPAGSTLRVDVDLHVEGPHAVVEFHQDTFLDGHPKLVRKGVRVRGGERWRLRYEIGVPHDANQLVVQLYAQTIAGDAATVRFDEAELTMTPGKARSAEAVVLIDDLSKSGPLRP
jgi:hypothetical protein